THGNGESYGLIVSWWPPYRANHFFPRHALLDLLEPCPRYAGVPHPQPAGKARQHDRGKQQSTEKAATGHSYPFSRLVGAHSSAFHVPRDGRDQLQHPADVAVRYISPAMVEDQAILAAGFFQGIAEDRQLLERMTVAKAAGNPEGGRVVPG